MSYILDALRRADAERERGAVPGIHAQQFGALPGDEEPGRRSRTSLWLIVGLSLALVAAIAWNLLARVPAGPMTSTIATAPTAVAPAPPVITGTPGVPPSAALPTAGAVPGAGAAPPGAGSASSPVPAARQSPSRAVATNAREAGSDEASRARRDAAPDSRGAGDRAAAGRGGADTPALGRAGAGTLPSLRPGEDRTAAARFGADTAVARPGAETATSGRARSDEVPFGRSAPAPSPKAAARDSGTSSGASTDTRVVTLRELPEDVRRGLPNISIGGSTYSSDKGSRMLMINGQIFREGDPVAGGVVLQQIKPRAAVFGVQGHRYEVSF